MRLQRNISRLLEKYLLAFAKKYLCLLGEKYLSACPPPSPRPLGCLCLPASLGLPLLPLLLNSTCSSSSLRFEFLITFVDFTNVIMVNHISTECLCHMPITIPIIPHTFLRDDLSSCNILMLKPSYLPNTFSVSKRLRRIEYSEKSIQKKVNLVVN